MMEQGTTMLVEFDGSEWHETQGSVRHRIAAKFGFRKHEIALMETGSKNGITETAAFTIRGIGYSVDLANDAIARAPQWDAKPADDGAQDDADGTAA